ncbi:MAG: hypothetical protein ACHQ0J_11965, partial [Candidatus Dormibacterales bacterium]
VLVIGVLLVYVAIAAMRHTGLRRLAWATLVVLALQVGVGAGAAVTDGAFFNGLHVAIATLVWAGALSMAILTAPRADRTSSVAHLTVENTPA